MERFTCLTLKSNTIPTVPWPLMSTASPHTHTNKYTSNHMPLSNTNSPPYAHSLVALKSFHPPTKPKRTKTNAYLTHSSSMDTQIGPSSKGRMSPKVYTCIRPPQPAPHLQTVPQPPPATPPAATAATTAYGIKATSPCLTMQASPKPLLAISKK